MNFESLEYLKTGNPSQRAAHNVLTSHGVMDKLQGYHPVLVGTIPIAIAIEGSDLDIICQFGDKTQFSNDLTTWFGHQCGFTVRDLPDRAAVLANFWLDRFELEVFGQHIPVKEQMAYRHMLAEYRLLQERGEPLRQQIIELKRLGHKTEPAFALALGLEGR